MGAKPSVTLKFKPVEGGEEIGFAAWWERDGKLQGGLDRRVKRVKVEMDDGTVHEIVRRGEREVSHWANLRDWRSGGSGGGGRRRDDDDGGGW